MFFFAGLKYSLVTEYWIQPASSSEAFALNQYKTSHWQLSPFCSRWKLLVTVHHLPEDSEMNPIVD